MSDRDLRIQSEPLYIVGPHFRSDTPVRIKGVRGKGKIVGSKFRAIVIEYTEYQVQIGMHVHTVSPEQLTLGDA